MPLTRLQHRALLALLTEPTVEKAAAKAGCTDRAIYKWLKEREFRGVWREAREQAFSAALATLQAGAQKAVAALLEIVNNADASDACRIQAARSVLEFGRLAAGEDLAAKVADLQAQVAAILGEPAPRGHPPQVRLV